MLCYIAIVLALLTKGPVGTAIPLSAGAIEER